MYLPSVDVLRTHVGSDFREVWFWKIGCVLETQHDEFEVVSAAVLESSLIYGHGVDLTWSHGSQYILVAR